MTPFSQLYTRFMIPPCDTMEDALDHWREKKLRNFLLAAICIGALTYILARNFLPWEGSLIPLICLGIIGLLFFRPRYTYRFRTSLFVGLTYITGAYFCFQVWPFGAGAIWLFSFPILACILLENRIAIFALILNGLTLIAIGLLMHLEIHHYLDTLHFGGWHFSLSNPLEKWIGAAVPFMACNTLVTVIIANIVNDFNNSLQKLRQSEKKYRRIFEDIMDIYFEMDLDGNLLTISPSITSFSGFPTHELKNNYAPLFQKNPHLLKIQQSFLLDLMVNDRVLNYVIPLTHKNGSPITGSVNARLLLNAKGEPERITGVLRDITHIKRIEEKKKELEERLNRSQKMEALGMLAGGVAHDLNNVLSGIVTYPELILMELPKGSPMALSMELIHEAGLRATEIVQDLLTLSRRGVTTREPVDLDQLILNFLKTPECKKILSFHPKVNVSYTSTAKLPYIKGSAIHLQKTVMNLIANAAEAQSQGGSIEISISNRYLDHPVKGYDQVQPGHYVVLGVEDHGVGIDPEDIKRIFEPFFTKKVMGRSGTGLGMAVVWGTVQDHFGYIDVISHPGKGTRFDLYFPTTHSSRPLEAIPDDTHYFMGNKEVVVVVDDIPDQREIASKILERLNYTVMAFESGEALIAFLENHRADLILLDMIMEPGMDGLETYGKIIEIAPDQKVIITSGFSKMDKMSKALKMGVNQYLKKPYTLEKISSAIYHVLRAETVSH